MEHKLINLEMKGFVFSSSNVSDKYVIFHPSVLKKVTKAVAL
jgi:hypothetical protein